MLKASSGLLARFKSIKSSSDLSGFLGVTDKQLTYLLYGGSRPTYSHFWLTKASGGKRHISVPPEKIQVFQRKIVSCVNAMVVPKEGCHGFSENRSILSNAEQHLNAEWLINLDLKDFFPSIHFGRVSGLFSSRPFGFHKTVSVLLAQICCNNRELPQGASTSPTLSNLICRGLDRDLLNLARRNRCRYSRYADDITFSAEQGQPPEAVVAEWIRGREKRVSLGRELVALIESHDFKINDAKTRISFRNEKMEVTGLTVGSRVNVPRAYVRDLRAILNDVRTNGETAAEARFHSDFFDRKKNLLSGPPSLRSHVLGRLAFLNMVRGIDDALAAKAKLGVQRDLGAFPDGVEIFGRAATHDLVKSCTWAIWMVDASGHDVGNGSAFHLKGYGLVSAEHVFKKTCDEFTVDRWEIAPSGNLMARTRIDRVKRFAHGDMAILEAAVRPVGVLLPSAGRPSVGDAVVGYGFPNLHPGDDLYEGRGYISQVKPVSGVTFASTNMTVRKGASGGPMIGSDGKVLAVIIGDATHHKSPNGGPLVGELENVKAQPWEIL